MGIADCCTDLLRCILIFTNVIVILAGLVLLIAGGVFMGKSFDFFPELADYSENVNSVLIPIMVIGGVFLLIGLLGCVGAIKQSEWFLKPYFVILLIVVIAEIALIIAAVVKKDDVKAQAEEFATDLFGRYKEKFMEGKTLEKPLTANEIVAVNTAQSLIGCCGLNKGPSYWKTATGSTDFPPGCCSGFDVALWKKDETKAVSDCTAAYTGGELYKKGCTEKMDGLLDEFGVVIIVVIVLVIVFEIVCMIAAVFAWKKKNQTG